MKDADTGRLSLFAHRIRRETVRALGHLGFGHIGGSMSITDVLAVLYGGALRHDPARPGWEGRDRLVLSKGHAGPALYAALALRGFFPAEELLTLNTPRTRLPSHCDRNLTPGVDMTTGSLGQGLSVALGMAYAFRLDGADNTVFAILGDGECDEGQVWEAALFAPHHRLDNVIAFVDYNGLQLDGYVKDILDLGDLAGKFAAFGWHTQEIDGNDVAAVAAAVAAARTVKDKPHMIVLRTIKGKGVPFAEGIQNNHSMNISKEMLADTLADFDARTAALEEEAGI